MKLFKTLLKSKTIPTILFCLVYFCSFAQFVQVGQSIEGENEDDESGFSVAMSGDGMRVVFSEPTFDGATEEEENIGRVRIFEFNGSSWEQLGQAIEGEEYGYITGGPTILDMNADGSRFVLGAPTYDGIEGILGFESGVTLVYELNGNSWEQIGQPITGELNRDASGASVSISSDGQRIAVGAHQEYTIDNPGGYVRIYELNGDTWEQIGQRILGEASGDRSGKAVSIDGDGSRVVIGATRNDGSGGLNSGHIRIYEFNGETWEQFGQDIDGMIPSLRFGYSVDISNDGNIVVTGNPFVNGNGLARGEVNIFKYEEGVWTQLGQDIIGQFDDSFYGDAVSLRDDGLCVAVGGSGWDDTYGSVSVFLFDGQNWIQQGQEILAEGAGDLFGFSLSLSADGSTVAVGAPLNDNANGENAGHIRIFASGFVGVKESTLLDKFKVYPNPTQGPITIEFDEAQNLDVRLLTSPGQIINRQKIVNANKFNLDIDTPTGIYFIELIDSEKRSAVIEVVKE